MDLVAAPAVRLPGDAISAPASGELFVATTVSDLLVTTDGGTSWGWSGPASALSTGNGGWQWQNPLPQGNGYEGGWFLDAKYGWLVGGGCIFHTSNGGLSLTRQAQHRVSFKAITFVDTLHGWAVGYPADARTGRVVIYRTTNGGRAWVRVPVARAGGIDSVSFANAKVGWAVSGRAVLHTVDGGLQWSVRTMLARGKLHCVQALSTRLVWVSGTANTLLRTVDGGATWNVSMAAPPPRT